MRPSRAHLAMMAAICAALALSAAAYENLLPNASFETDADGDGIADGWQPNVHAGAEGHFELDRSEAHAGTASQRIVHSNASAEWVRTSATDVPVRPEQVYCVEGHVKATGGWTVILYEFPAGDGESTYISHTIAAGQGTAWRRIGKAVTTKADTARVKLSLITLGAGEAWFDDFRLFGLEDVPDVRIPQLSTAPVIDGDGDDAAWDGAVEIGGFLQLGGGGQRAEQDTVVMAGSSGDSLYLRWRCTEPDVDGVLAGDPASWAHDTVEVFITDGDGDGGCRHFGLTPAGGKLQDARAGSGSYATDWFSVPGAARLAPVEWVAAAQRGEGQWTGEMSIPLEALGGVPRAGEQWRLQLARSRKLKGVEQNSCWSYTPGDRFYDSERFGRAVFLSRPSRTLSIVRPRPSVPPAPLRVVPQPQSMSTLPGEPRRLPETVVLALGDGLASSALADVLRGRVAGQGGKRLRLTDLSAAADADIVVGVPESLPSLGPLWGELGPRAGTLKDWQTEEAYALDTTSRPARITARGERGLLYGAQTLCQLLCDDPVGLHLPRVRIGDWPELEWRGWHLISPSTSSDIDAAKHLVEVLAALKMNWVSFQIDNRLQYTRDPDLGAPNAPSKAELSGLVKHAERLGLEVIPMTQCWSHFSYFLNKEKYRHLAEVQTPDPGARHRFWNYCPRHPETHRILFSLIEEQLECFPNAEYFHAGLDEITFEPIGVCERCKGTPGGDLLSEEILRLHEFLAAKKLTMCMWGDQLLVEHNGKPPYNTAQALPEVPRDVVIFDWHYGASTTFPSVGFFAKHGFPVVASGWYEPLNVTRLARTAFDDGVLGYGGTTWYGIGNIRREIRLMAGMPLAAEFSWTPRRPDVGELAYAPADVFRELWRRGPRAQPAGFVPIPLAGHVNRTLADSRRRLGWLGLGPANDLSALPTGRQWLGDIPFDIASADGDQCIVLAAKDDGDRELPARAWQVPVNVRARRLAFLHACSRPARFTRHIYDRQRLNPGPIARYVVHFADASSTDVTLRWNLEMADWNSQLGSAYGRPGWVGRTRAGSLARLELFEWENPKPEVEITAVDIVSLRSTVRPVVVGITAVQ